MIDSCSNVDQAQDVSYSTPVKALGRKKNAVQPPQITVGARIQTGGMSPKAHNVSKSAIWQGESRSQMENVVDSERVHDDETLQVRTGRIDDTA